MYSWIFLSKFSKILWLLSYISPSYTPGYNNRNAENFYSPALFFLLYSEK